MNQPREFISDVFHALAQPVTELRATVELGLSKKLNEQAAHKVLEHCLHIVDLLMRDLAVFRESASLEDAPPLMPCDGSKLLQHCVEEMAIVAQSVDVPLRLTMEQADVQCNEAMFQRAMFVLLDEMIASAQRGREILISLRNCEEGARIEVHGGMLHGQRQILFQKLMQFAGGRNINSKSDHFSITFQTATIDNCGQLL